ncbi:MAG: NAD-dependent succinate-semialdehyde dehydrogenase [Sphingomonadales bacterium]|nr:NAD-dependent succinate-semialdehyde dehydrogenase [Sphingomonadales bacterium]PIX65103.1 MAG: succinate-semialdehyde dehydrogenase [Sphingomonadales bacterium CG_4_10_14_3_um_filter_58_15]NCO48065.1 NAD-dependent succinate-semialdehyde dehydrogenase [Sphingomonadales bacterium]NCO99635.1 NAD-dependent succinate-semialdehyde dehydrogenase [Sphingomonadales bacterium]NCP27198.1 NAD-dependent succinate-semialdehyde dehydrogenase [Sphingomonadales bacterium]
MTDKTIETINPLTEQMLKSYPVMSDKEAMDVVENCQKAFLDWRLKSLDERASVIAAIADELRNSKEEFAQLMTDEMGKLLSDGREEIELCASICDYTAKHGPEMLADEEHEVPEGRGLVTYSPLGVIYGIQPWNFPCYQAIRYSISSLMVGNGVLLKHSENCTGSGLLLRDIYERAGLPKGLFGVLLITHDQSDAIIEHKLVRGVTLTGSDKAGRTVAQKAASVSKKTVLELGSNDAYMVFDDADLDLAIKTCAQGRLFNNGQTCVNAKRFIVTEKNYDAFVEGYAAAFKDVTMGDPNEEDTQLGPLVSSSQRDQIHKQVEESVSKGAKIVAGGKMPDRTGWFYPATALVDVAPGQPAYDDEIFGPVASIIKAKDDEDAMRIANDSRYGLGGGIFSKDVDRAVKMASTYFDTGMININTYSIASPDMPFGGVKDSGYGREHGEVGLKEFVNVKAITIAA